MYVFAWGTLHCWMLLVYKSYPQFLSLKTQNNTILRFIVGRKREKNDRNYRKDVKKERCWEKARKKRKALESQRIIF